VDNKVGIDVLEKRKIVSSVWILTVHGLAFSPITIQTNYTVSSMLWTVWRNTHPGQ